MTAFDPRPICRVLNEEGVRYVLIGGFAAAVHGSPLPTSDVDIVPAREEENLERLARALHRLRAHLRTAAGPVAAPIDARFLKAMPFMLNLATDHGDVDLTFSPAGPRAGFEEWNVDAIDVEISAGLVVRIGALDDIIDSKRAAGRPKDQLALPYLESLRDELGSDRAHGDDTGRH
jgi:hypothetical protein